MLKQMLLKAGFLLIMLGGLTFSVAQEKPSLRPTADGGPVAGQAKVETQKEKAAKRRMAKLTASMEAFSKRLLESPKHQKRTNDREPKRAGASGTTTRTSRTCLICRLKQVDTASAGRTTTKYEENECSRWYAANVEPKHTHVWERSTCTFGNSADGSSFVACNPGHFPIWLLSPETQLAVYQHFKNPTEARDLFLSLADDKVYNERLDQYDDDKGHLIVDALEEWEAAEFPGSWKEWWEAWYAQHIEEHKVYLRWLRSHSGLNFSDWQKQQKASGGAAAASAKGKK
jgi:hypothetical protein